MNTNILNVAQNSNRRILERTLGLKVRINDLWNGYELLSKSLQWKDNSPEVDREWIWE